MTQEPQKQIKFPVWNLETDEIEELCMDEASYQEWLEAEQRAEYEQYQRYERALERDRRAMLYDRD